MNYIFYKSKHGNFGDDLNEWLWPKLFPLSKHTSDTNFLGIGSILYEENPSLAKIHSQQKLVFGTGVRPTDTYSNLKTDHLWNVLFLRGPLSSFMLNNKYEYITDAAYALRHVDSFPKLLASEKKYKISLMPYFKSLEYFDWPAICKELGYHYISPLSENGVEFTLQEIAASEKLITEAMHGAIVADLLRVPWHRFVFTTPHTEGGKVSDFKWNDWLLSIGVHNPEVTFISFFQKTRIQNWLKSLSGNKISVEFLLKKRIKGKLLLQLPKIDAYYLSADDTIATIDQKIESRINLVKEIINV
jgi:hypothetical protein